MNIIEGRSEYHSSDYLLITTKSGLGYRLEAFGFDAKTYIREAAKKKSLPDNHVLFPELTFFVESVFDVRTGATTRYAILSFDRLELLWALRPKMKGVATKLIVTLVNKYTPDELTVIHHNKDSAALSSIKGIGKKAIDVFFALNDNLFPEVSKDSSYNSDDVNWVVKTVESMGKKITEDERNSIIEFIKSGENKESALKDFLKSHNK